MKKLFKPFTNIYLQSFAYAALVTSVILLSTDKYQAKRIEKKLTTHQIEYHWDLDKDGNSEHIIYHTGYKNRLSISVSTKGKIIDQWNFTGTIIISFFPYFCDYDNDGIEDIILLTRVENKIYLHILDAINKKIKLENKFITQVYRSKGAGYDYGIVSYLSSDVNNDRYKEIYFLFSSAYVARPRNIFAYFPKQDTILKSPESYSLILQPNIIDLDKDGTPEITVSSFAYGNTSKEKPYSDMYAWLMVFTPDLKFKFEPVRFDKYPSRMYVLPFCSGTKMRLLLSYQYSGTENLNDFIALYDVNGKEIRRKNFPPDKNFRIYSSLKTDKSFKKIFIINNSGDFLKPDSLLNLKKISNIKNIASPRIEKKLDIDKDGNKELVFRTITPKEMLITRNNFTHPVKLHFDEPPNIHIPAISLVKEKAKDNLLMIDYGQYTYLYSYGLSLSYKYWFLLFGGAYLLSMAFIFLIKSILNYRTLKIDNAQRKISELQMQLIQNQIDPHFTFNILASFGKLLNDTEKEKAHYLFKKYSGMLKQTFDNAEKITVTLSEELEFVKTYLDLQKFRYPGKFTYAIKNLQELDLSIEIPRMLLHIFVENAVKHGLRHLKKNGKLLIEGKKQNGTIIIKISDNGIGRKEARQYNKYSTGKGLKLVNQIIDDYNKLYKIKIGFKISDLYKNTKAAGTEVRISIPYSLKRVI
ncbi:MAG: histidine kinase [Bacteroidales bacterium]|nr:histidine kinase [Bacteroidales bacterium]